MKDCIFCKIIDGDLPSYQIYEDSEVLAFLDIAPVNYGHVLVVPKKHAANYEEISENDLSKVFSAVKKIGKALKSSLPTKGYNTIVNNDPIAGQIIPHFHVHVIPRNEKDGLELWPQGKYGDGEAEEISQKIISHIQ
jgi:histidine triad (HIT) family protein